MQLLPGRDKSGDPTLLLTVPSPIQSRKGISTGIVSWAGRKWLRKPQFTYGWDWVDALPNIGIWRGVHLEGRTHASLHDLRLDTLLQDGRVLLEMEAVVENLHPWSERVCELVLEIQPPDGGQYSCIGIRSTLFPGRNTVKDTFEIPEAKLWWPNGVGEQPLYKIKASVLDSNGKKLRSAGIFNRLAHHRAGPLSLDQKAAVSASASMGRSCSAGEPISARTMPSSPGSSDAKYEALVAEAKNANMNMIRINGCSIFEPAVFYEACDRAGIYGMARSATHGYHLSG